MAVKLRLARHGSKKRPYYRIVAANASARRDGRYLEQVGTYDATRNPPTITLKRDKITYWLGQGAKPSTTVRNLLAVHMDGPDVILQPRQHPAISTQSPKAPAEKEAKAKDAPAKAKKAPAEPKAKAEKAPAEPEAKAEEAPAEPEAKAEEAPAEPEAKAAGDDDADKSGE